MYRIFGYDDLCIDFNYENLTLPQVVAFCRRSQNCVIFFDGLSRKTVNRLKQIQPRIESDGFQLPTIGPLGKASSQVRPTIGLKAE